MQFKKTNICTYLLYVNSANYYCCFSKRFGFD